MGLGLLKAGQILFKYRKILQKKKKDKLYLPNFHFDGRGGGDTFKKNETAWEWVGDQG